MKHQVKLQIFNFLPLKPPTGVLTTNIISERNYYYYFIQMTQKLSLDFIDISILNLNPQLAHLISTPYKKINKNSVYFIRHGSCPLHYIL